MPASVTLSTTTLVNSVGPSADTLVLASTAGVGAGTRLFIDGELLKVNSVAVEGVKVRRGDSGTAASSHVSGSTVYIGRADQFYSQDPVGTPLSVIPVSPYINVINGSTWFAMGDTVPDGNSARWWQRGTPTYAVGSLGIRTTTTDPTAST
jgi:hypothetical protein